MILAVCRNCTDSPWSESLETLQECGKSTLSHATALALIIQKLVCLTYSFTGVGFILDR